MYCNGRGRRHIKKHDELLYSKIGGSRLACKILKHQRHWMCVELLDSVFDACPQSLAAHEDERIEVWEVSTSWSNMIDNPLTNR